MLEQAVEGNIPLIRCTTDDSVHAVVLLEGLLSDYKVGRFTSKQKRCDVYYIIGDPRGSLVDLYNDAEENGYTIIIINGKPNDCYFDVGEITLTVELIVEFLTDNIDSDVAEEVAPHLVGLSYLTLKRILSLCSTYFGVISTDTLRKTKNKICPTTIGVYPVDTDTEFFFRTDKHIQHWISINHQYMTHTVDPRLHPKGLLLHGDAGTGKTELAKHIAREWDIPLFLLDLNSMLTKWQGEAESHLNKALRTFDEEGTCVVLFDEVEKLFNTNNDNDTSQRLLSRILWWLQERQSKVFVVMTCNDMVSIPPELYRAGRISAVFELKGVEGKDIKSFVTTLLKSFGITKKLYVANVYSHVKGLHGSGRVPQAVLNQAVIDYLQENEYGL